MLSLGRYRFKRAIFVHKGSILVHVSTQKFTFWKKRYNPSDSFCTLWECKRSRKCLQWNGPCASTLHPQSYSLLSATRCKYSSIQGSKHMQGYKLPRLSLTYLQQMRAVCVPLSPAHPSDKRHLADPRELASGSPRDSLRLGPSQDVRNTIIFTIIHSQLSPDSNGTDGGSQNIECIHLPAWETCCTQTHFA